MSLRYVRTATLAALCTALLPLRQSSASGYYNLGSFWQASVGGSLSLTVTRIQSVDSGDLGGTTYAVPQMTVTAGNTLVAKMFVDKSTPALSISDTAGNVWTPILTQTNTNSDCYSGSGGKIQLWYATVASSGNTTVTGISNPASAGQGWLQVTEYQGVSGTGTVLSSNSKSPTSGSSATHITTNSVTTSATALIYGTFDDANAPGGDIIADAGVSAIFTGTAYDTVIVDNTAAAANTYNLGATNTGSSDCWLAAVVAFKPTQVAIASLNPTIASVTPKGGPVGGGTSITISGGQFDPNATVTVGGNACNVTGRSGSNSITCTVAASSSGFADVVVRDVNGHTATAQSGYLYGTVGAPTWLGAIPGGWSWQTFSASSPLEFIIHDVGTEVGFDDVRQIAFSSGTGTGYLYATDLFNARIMKFDASSGALIGWTGMVGEPPTSDPLSRGCTSTPPGTATPGWCLGGASSDGLNYWADGTVQSPVSVAVDPAGTTLYVADSGWANNRIDKFDATTGQFLGWMGYGANSGGTGGCPNSNPGSVTTGWCVGGSSYWLDWTPTEGGFDTPTGITVDPSGTYFYVLDYGNARVEQFAVSNGAYVGWLGAVNSAAGIACASSNPGCTPGGANAFSGGFVTGGTPKSSSISGGLTTGSNGQTPHLFASGSYLYVADSDNDRIERYNLPSGTFAGWLGWVQTSNGSNCTTTNAFSGTWCNAGGASTSSSGLGGLSAPNEVAVDATYLYVADKDNQRVSRYLLNGSSPQWIGESTSTNLFNGGWGSTGAPTNTYYTNPPAYAGGMSSPNSLAVDTGNGYLYVSDEDNRRINRFTLSTGAFTRYLYDLPTVPTGWNSGTLSISGSGDGMFLNAYLNKHGIVLDETGGYLYATDPGAGRIEKFNLSTGAFLGWVGEVDLPPTAGAANCSTRTQGQKTPGWCTGGSAQPDSGDGGLARPNGLALSPAADYLYVADAANSRIQRFSASTGAAQGFVGYVTGTGTGCGSSVGATSAWCAGSNAVAGLAGGGSNADGEFQSPTGLATDGSGNLYAADFDEHRVVKYNAAGAFQGWIGYGTNTGGGAGCPGAGGGVATGWCKGGTSVVSQNAAVGGFDQPQWLAVDSSGYLWVEDHNNARIQKFNASTGAYIAAKALDSGAGAMGFGIDSSGQSVFAYENYNGPRSLLRYAASTLDLFGGLAPLSVAPFDGGQVGCSSLDVFSLPSLWCQLTNHNNWGMVSSRTDNPASQIVTDSARHYLYYFDSGNEKLMRIPINL